MFQITKRLSIPEHEITFTASRSGGPGGQHVNKVSSRVTLHFDVGASTSLSETQKKRILTRLGTRINKNGVLRVATQKYRSQAANRKLAGERFAALLRTALTPDTTRRQTTIPVGTKAQRLEAKKRRGRLKQQRAQKAVWHDA